MPLRPTILRCEYLEDPLGIDVPEPRLSWTLEAAEGGQRQAAYQIRVNDGDLWDSGRVESDESIHIPYRGRTLESGMHCIWQVRVWPARHSRGGPLATAGGKQEIARLAGSFHQSFLYHQA